MWRWYANFTVPFSSSPSGVLLNSTTHFLKQKEVMSNGIVKINAIVAWKICNYCIPFKPLHVHISKPCAGYIQGTCIVH